MEKLIKDMLMTNGKWSYKRVTSLYILNCAIFYAFIPLFYKDFDVKEFVFVALLGYSATMVGVNAWEKRHVFKSKEKESEEIDSEGQ